MLGFVSVFQGGVGNRVQSGVCGKFWSFGLFWVVLGCFGVFNVMIASKLIVCGIFMLNYEVGRWEWL